ncbi:hypothetical protein K493DRAFT_308100 [Basidiobolus meristosporus CBS 931.73]|uniref:Uncharacterized protein n=1 Tax=Basidiobolus meristosporus CBS 931.73 TaxID=1314790 RepID=A0A1Y1X6M5_9FUNG|nr:hypothetical protein K493DRAFT_308100 [Basidiobolus meristosporus CBS 931.73]|eukprot:ORX81348.1 hypothetical protein K493DRAFT_308100 [Basidiobolus meristosporus CBS 931.73]
MSVSNVNTLFKDHKSIVELPPPYSTVARDHQLDSKPEPSTLKMDTSTKLDLEVPVEETMLGKMVHLESLCTSMQNMLEFQTFAYKDIKAQLTEIGNSVNNLQGPKPVSKDIQKLNKQDLLNSQLDSADEGMSEDSDEDVGYGRVCNMLDHLLNDAQAAIDTRPPSEVNYSVEQDEELASSASLIIPLRQRLADEIVEEKIDYESEFTRLEACIPKAESASNNTTEVRLWCQVVTNGQSQAPYHIHRKLVLPNISRGKKKVVPFCDASIDHKVLESGGVVGLYRHSKTIVAMVYWTLLFALGVLLLDRHLLELASKQVTHAMEEIEPETQDESLEYSNVEPEDNPPPKIHPSSAPSKKGVNHCYHRSRRNSM